jgi:hypothetical protein
MDNPVLGGYLVDQTGSLFLHEWAWKNNGQDRAVSGGIYAESGAIVLGEGDRRYHVKQVVFDSAPSQGVVGYSFYVREEAGDDAGEFEAGLYTKVNAGLMDVRFSGRSVRMRMVALQDVPWSVGRPRLDIRPGGRR